MTYLRIAGFAILAAILMASGYKMGARTWETKYRAELAAQWQQKAMGEETARKALEKQLSDAHATADNNRQVMHDLQQDAAAVVADRDNSIAFYRGLLANAARSRTSGSGVSETSDRRPSAGASGEGSGSDVAQLLVNASEECSRNANRLDALIAQIKPQL